MKYDPELSCRCVPAAPGKKSKDLWNVVLEMSPLYPEGGGQPSDRGSITDLANNTVVRTFDPP